MRDQHRGPVAEAVGAARRDCFSLLALLLLGCGTSPPKPTKVNGTIQAAEGLNPSVSSRPSPLRMRVYELKSVSIFNQADFMALYQSDQATLGADVTGRDEFTLQPGETRPWVKTLSAETRFIGVVALYRDLEHAVWRTVVPVQPGREYKMAIRADALALSASVQP